MAQEIINVGAVANDRTGDAWRDAFIKVNNNTTELYDLVDGANNTLIINEESDFLVQDATTITLKTGFNHYIGAVISTSKRFICEEQSAITGPSGNILTINYTGSDALFTTANGFIMLNLLYLCASGKAWDITPSIFPITARNSVCLSCVDFATIESADFLLEGSAAISISGDGLVYSGSNNLLQMNNSLLATTSASSTAIDLGSATFAGLRINSSGLTGVPGGIGLSGLAASANIDAGTVAEVSDSDLSGGGITPLSGIEENDVRWTFRDNDASLMNSINASSQWLYESTPASFPHVIPVINIGDWHEIGTPDTGIAWDSDIDARFTVSSTGVATYNGERSVVLQIIGRSTVEPVTGADVLEMRIAKNWDGTVSDAGIYKSRSITENTQPAIVTCTAIITIDPGDNIRQIFANTDATTDIRVFAAAQEIT